MFSIRDIDSGVIFEKYSIAEIVDIEKKIRQDIEKKKEDLRTMVGERYRDLIEAADTITKMRDGSAQITDSILHIEHLCSSMSNANQGLYKTTSTNSKLNKVDDREKLKLLNFFIIMLMEAPELIWKAIDECRYLDASIIYLTIKQLNTHFERDEMEVIQNHFPIIRQQIANIDHIGKIIIDNCVNCITAVNKDNQITCECISSILLLTKKNLQLIFQEFIDIRLNAINNIFEKRSSLLSIKEELLNLTSITLVTIHQLETIFAEESVKGNKNLRILLMEIHNGSYGTNMQSLKNQFSQIISEDFILDLRIEDINLKKEYLDNGISEFFQSYELLITKHIPAVLNHCQTIKSLSNIRQEIFDLIFSKEDNYLFVKPNIWIQYFRKHFLFRIQAIIDESFEVILQFLKEQIEEIIQQDVSVNKKFSLDCDVSTYIWNESSFDLSTNAAWVPITQRPKSNILKMSPLHFKCKAITPSIQNLCCGLEEEMKKLGEDVQSYTTPSVMPNSLDTSKISLNVMSSNSSNDDILMIQSDGKEVENSFRKTCENFLQRLIEFLKLSMKKFEEEIKLNESSNKLVHIDRILILGRFSLALRKYNESFSTAILQQNKIELNKKLLKTSNNSAEENRWQYWVETLDKFSNSTYDNWRNYIISKNINKFESDLLMNSDVPAVVRSISLCTQWDSIEIEEENEEGIKIKSTIRVPMQVSASLHCFLFEICKECIRVAAHSIPLSAIQKLRQLMLNNLLATYSKFIQKSSQNDSTKLLQNESLQFLFDVKFLSILLMFFDRAEEMAALKKASEDLQNQLESVVDPFDLDVFRPHIEKHLTRALQKSCILYGILLGWNSTLLNTHVPGGGQEVHNILPLTNCQVRFVTLPINVHNKFNKMESKLIK